MSKTEEAIEILRALGLPSGQQNERSALTLLALADVGPRTPWSETKQPPLRIWDLMGFMRSRYGKDYAANSRETIRRQTIHQFEQARIVDRNLDDPDRPTNSGKTVYTLTPSAAQVLKSYGTTDFEKTVTAFIKEFGSLEKAYNSSRASHRVPLKLPQGNDDLFITR